MLQLYNAVRNRSTLYITFGDFVGRFIIDFCAALSITYTFRNKLLVNSCYTSKFPVAYFILNKVQVLCANPRMCVTFTFYIYIMSLVGTSSFRISTTGIIGGNRSQLSRLVGNPGQGEVLMKSLIKSVIPPRLSFPGPKPEHTHQLRKNCPAKCYCYNICLRDLRLTLHHVVIHYYLNFV